MGLLQAAYRTYETHAHLVGATQEGRQMLTPVAHMVQNADIELTIDQNGVFQGAALIAKEDMKTTIPATMESASRTSSPWAHPLCDQLQYLAPGDGEKHEAYLSGLRLWARSQHSHPKVQAILRYIEGETIVPDLLAAALIDKAYEKKFIRFRVIGDDSTRDACWEDKSLFAAYTAYYASHCAGMQRDICMLTGEEDVRCEAHPKGVVAASGNAKLLSANDSAGFTYRGRFTQAAQAYNVGYTASQKAHSGLRWVAANESVMIGGRSFLCWNPEGKRLPSSMLLGHVPSGNPDFIAYRKELRETLQGYGQELAPMDDVMIVTLDAATTGRLSVTYCNELKASDFLARLEDWYLSCCWDTRFGIQSPSLKRIAGCAFGVQRGNFIETDDRAMREHVQRLVACLLNRGRIPQDIVTALTSKASNLLPLTTANREQLLMTACAIIRKYKNDKAEKEEWGLALDLNCTERSYLFGRLLAIAEKIERDTYEKGEERETNAMRLQAAFVQRPMHTWMNLEGKLQPYFNKQKPFFYSWYKDLIGEIFDKLPGPNDPTFRNSLSESYLMGYYLQRSALYTKKDQNTKEENTDGSAEQEN